MKYQIVYDKPGRIRFRCGGYAFDKSLEGSIRKAVLSNAFITGTEVHSENGGILICYQKGFRSQVIAVIRALNPHLLTPVKSEESHDIAQIDHDFRDRVIRTAAVKLAAKLLLPVPLRRLVILYRGLKYVWKGMTALLDGRLTVDVLDAASIGACLAQRNYQTADSVMFLLNISSLLEDYTRARTRAVLADSLAVKTDRVWLVTEHGDVMIPMSALQKEDVIRIRTGSVIPVDGEICDGEAYINESSMTGEPLAVMKSVGASVFAGTAVEEGNISVKVRSLASDTKISKIIELIDNSEHLKAGIQSRAEHLADSIVPFSFLGFGLTLLLTRNVTKAISVLMVDYSCAIKLSTPISVISAIREASDMQMTVKGGKYLEAFAAADTVVFDKTGTLTNAQPVLERVIPFGGYSEDEALKIAACLEEHFPHSVARAIVKGAADRGIDHAEEHAEVNYIVAHGIATTLHGHRAIIGSRHFVCEDEHIAISEEQQSEIDSQSGACSVVYLAIGDSLAGALCISDPPRTEAREAVASLRKAGIRNIIMLTGDSEKAAHLIAQQLGITEYYSQVLPEEKHSMVERLKSDGRTVIMIGDGINDAPALAAADASVAMSDASDIAKETADITLRGTKLTELVRLRRLSELLMERIQRNYRFIVLFNSILLLSGFAGLISPSVSAFLHNASTMGICAKSMLPLMEDKKQKSEHGMM